MSTIASKIDDIANLRFEPMPRGRAIKAVKVATSDGAVVALGLDGRLYSTQVKGHFHYSLTSTALDKSFRACVKLGVLSEAAIRQHRAHRDAAAKASDAEYAAKAILREAKALGMPLTKSQCAMLTRASKASKEAQ